ncbi:MAG: 30S ribosomal protein S18, partial [Campylobacterales bacterium]
MAEKKKYSRKVCKYTEAKIDYIDYKDPTLLKHSLSERFKIMPRRLTGNSKRAQEMVEMAIKRARHMALIPYIADRRKVETFTIEDYFEKNAPARE